jgi:hypothetical protein
MSQFPNSNGDGSQTSTIRADCALPCVTADTTVRLLVIPRALSSVPPNDCALSVYLPSLPLDASREGLVAVESRNDRRLLNAV